MHPFHSESERDYHAMVGLYIALWAGVEATLEGIVDSLYVFFSAKDIEPERPLSLDRKFRFLKKAFSRIEKLAHEDQEVRAIMAYLKEESVFRHDLIHGTKINLLKSDPYYAVMRRPINRSEGSGERVIKVMSKDIENHYHDLGQKSFFLMGLTRRIGDVLDAVVLELKERTLEKEARIRELEAALKMRAQSSD